MLEKLCINLLYILCFVSNRQTHGKKTILFWTPYHHHDDWDMTSWWPSFTKTCKQDCVFSRDKSLADSADALVFHSLDLPWFAKSVKLPSASKRSSNQVYVFLSHESPVMDTQDLRNYDDFFNWTMTYRLDSDIYFPYFVMTEKSDKNSKSIYPPKSWMRPEFSSLNMTSPDKKHLVSWAVSNCRTSSQRETYIQKLSQFVPINQVGRCNGVSCDANCYKNMWSQSKFYLALENSNCRDYVTEKFWNSLKFGVVPIVSGDGGHSRIAPPHSYIDIKDFSTVEDLSNYLLMLDNNSTMYEQYFWWRQFYQLQNDTNIWAEAMCNLCTKLDKNEHKKSIKIQDWWEVNKCTSPNNKDWFSVTNMIFLFLHLSDDLAASLLIFNILLLIVIIKHCANRDVPYYISCVYRIIHHKMDKVS